MTLPLVLLGLLLAHPIEGEAPDRSSPPVSSTQTALRDEAVRFASAWSRQDAGALAESFTPHGIRLHLQDEDHLLLRPRQAEAALKVFLKRYEGGETAVLRVSPSGEEAETGFAEIRWRTGSPRVSEPVIFTVFVGYVFQDGGWSVTEIRVLF